ncbi:MAG: hypothetical protein H8E59_00395 [Actinobacteria bacterium]|nr:hypothetical protein [Actinomycetota bacterium]
MSTEEFDEWTTGFLNNIGRQVVGGTESATKAALVDHPEVGEYEDECVEPRPSSPWGRLGRVFGRITRWVLSPVVFPVSWLVRRRRSDLSRRVGLQ